MVAVGSVDREQLVTGDRKDARAERSGAAWLERLVDDAAGSERGRVKVDQLHLPGEASLWVPIANGYKNKPGVG